MATLHPLDANQLLRQMTADLGRPVTPAEGIAIAMALRLMADAMPASSAPHPAAIILGHDLRALAGHIVTTIGLAQEVNDDHRPGESVSYDFPCGAFAKLNDDPQSIVPCIKSAGHSGRHQARTGFVWADDESCSVGF